MSGLPPIAMAYLTSAPFDAPDAIRLAADIGYDAVGLRIAPAVPGGAFTPLIGRPELLRETRALLRSTGVMNFDVEIIRIHADFRAEDYRNFIDVCVELGARCVLVVIDDANEGRATDAFGALCDLAAPAKISMNLEFMSFTAVKSAKAACRIVERAGRPNGGVLVDALHAFRTDTTLEDIAAIPRNALNYMQICDAPAGIPVTEAEIIHTARAARLIPGEGGLDLAGLMGALPPGLPVAAEIPNEEGKARFGVEGWARRCHQATLGFLTAAG